MWYVTGGVAWSAFDLNNYYPARGHFNSSTPTRVNRSGWIVGISTVYALLGGWSVIANSSTPTSAPSTTAAISATSITALGCASADVKVSRYIWRVGMNYRFDWARFGKGKAPVVAKY